MIFKSNKDRMESERGEGLELLSLQRRLEEAAVSFGNTLPWLVNLEG